MAKPVQMPTMPTLPMMPTLPTFSPPTLPTLPTMTMPALPTSLQALVDGNAQRQARQARQQRAAFAALAAVLALLLLLTQCPDDEAAPLPVAVAEACPEVPTCGEVKKKKTVPRPKTTKPIPRTGTTVPQPRDVFAIPQLRSPPWLQALRIQVSARSLALAACFNGTEKPGALRLTATVTPSSGRLADADLEALSDAVAIDEKTRRCVLEVLQSPPYQLRDALGGDADGDDIGTRISLILEF